VIVPPNLLRQKTAPPQYTESRRKTTNQTVAIAGLFQNNGRDKTIQMYRLMKQTASYFGDHHLLFLENDSVDDTGLVLQTLCQTDTHATCLNLKVQSELPKLIPFANDTTDGPFAPYRFSRMSWFRNQVLQWVKKTSYDYFVFVDADLFGNAWLPSWFDTTFLYVTHGMGLHPGFWGGSSHAWKPGDVVETLHRVNNQHGKDWSAVCFYSTFGTHLHHYDMLAFRLSPNTPIPPAARRYQPTWNYQDWNYRLSGSALHKQTYSVQHLHMAMLAFGYAHSTDLIPVQSCFGALTLYQRSRLQPCWYEPRATDCEHVTLHTCLQQHLPDSIYLDPQSRVYYDTYSYANS
jgi:hypothetical protein